jgi:hypothetical protein
VYISQKVLREKTDTTAGASSDSLRVICLTPITVENPRFAGWDLGTRMSQGMIGCYKVLDREKYR